MSTDLIEVFDDYHYCDSYHNLKVNYCDTVLLLLLLSINLQSKNHADLQGRAPAT